MPRVVCIRVILRCCMWRGRSAVASERVREHMESELATIWDMQRILYTSKYSEPRGGVPPLPGAAVDTPLATTSPATTSPATAPPPFSSALTDDLPAELEAAGDFGSAAEAGDADPPPKARKVASRKIEDARRRENKSGKYVRGLVPSGLHVPHAELISDFARALNESGCQGARLLATDCESHKYWKFGGWTPLLVQTSDGRWGAFETTEQRRALTRCGRCVHSIGAGWGRLWSFITAQGGEGFVAVPHQRHHTASAPRPRLARTFQSERAPFTHLTLT